MYVCSYDKQHNQRLAPFGAAPIEIIIVNYNHFKIATAKTSWKLNVSMKGSIILLVASACDYRIHDTR